MSTGDCRIERRHGTGRLGAALRTEAAILAHARHPGVAELLAVDRDDAGDAIWIDVAAPHGPTLRTAGLPTGELAGAVAMVATTVADLHEIGVAHCDVSADAVRLGADGRAVLTGFHAARWIDGPAARWHSHPLARADDRALGRMLGAQVRLLGGPEAPITRRRLGLRPPRRHPTDDPLDTLSRLAGAAAGGQLSSRALAEALATDVEGARVPVVDASADQQVGPWEDDTSARGVTAPDGDLAGRGARQDDSNLVGWGARQDHTDRLPGGDADGRPRSADDAPARVPRAVAVGAGIVLGLAVASSLVVAVHPHDPARRTVSQVASCSGTAITCPPYADGVLTFGSVRYTVGGAGDIVAVGRWGCRAARLALLDATSGTLWSFASWPTGSTPVAPHRVMSIGRASRVAVRSTSRCDHLFVTTGGGAGRDVTAAVAR